MLNKDKTPYFDINDNQICIGDKIQGPDYNYYIVYWMSISDYTGIILKSTHIGKIIKNPFLLWNKKVTIVN